MSTEANPRKEPISNAGNLKKGSYHRSYTLRRKGLNGLSFNCQSLENGSVKRERKCGLLMHASIPIVYFLYCFLSNLSFFSFISPCILFSSIISFLPLASLLPYCLWLPLLYRLPLWDLPFCPLLFLAPYGHPSKTAHYPVSCPATTSTQSVLVAPFSISRQNYLSCFLPLFALVLPLWMRIKLPHHLPLWHASSGPNPYLTLLGEMPSQ